MKKMKYLRSRFEVLQLLVRTNFKVCNKRELGHTKELAGKYS